MSNLRFIKQASTTGVNQITITDIFNADYHIYQIYVDDIDQSSSGGSHINMRLVNSGGSVIVADYAYGMSQVKSYSGWGNDYNASSTYMRTISQITGGSEVGAGHCITIFTPFSSSHATFMYFEGSGFYSGAGTQGTKGISVYKNIESITGVQFYTDTTSTTFDSFKCKVYGLREDST